MPRLGFLQPVMDAYNTAAGRGIHFWSFAQSLSALEATWGWERCRTLVHLAEVVQILGFPRMDDAGAEALSAAIGSATFENRSENMSGTVQDARLLGASRGETLSVVKERLVTPDDLMTMGPDEQYVVAAKDVPRDALHFRHARYWLRPDARLLADPNPFASASRRRPGTMAEERAPLRRRPSRPISGERRPRLRKRRRMREIPLRRRRRFRRCSRRRRPG